MKIKILSVLFIFSTIYIITPSKILLAEGDSLEFKQILDSLKIVVKTEMNHINTNNKAINDIFIKDDGSLDVDCPAYDIPAKPLKTITPNLSCFSDSFISILMNNKDIKVWIKMWVDIDGTVKNVKIIKPSGYPELDSAAVEAAYKWIFTPAQLKGKPVRMWVAAPINFKLQ
jgi:TonB family protein